MNGWHAVSPLYIHLTPRIKTSLLESTLLPAATYQETEDFLWNLYIVNIVRKLTLGAVIILRMVYSCLFLLKGKLCWLFLENYFLRVEHFGNLIQVSLIQSSKLSVTIYIYIYTARQLFIWTAKFIDNFKNWNQILVCNLNFFYILFRNLFRPKYTGILYLPHYYQENY